MDTDAELSRADVLLLLGSMPERVSDIVTGLDDARLAYRHGPAFPSLGELIGHLAAAGGAVDALVRHAYLDGTAEADIRASIDPQAADLGRPGSDLVDDYSRVRRRTVDLLRGLADSDWERVVRDPRQGEFSLLDVCRLAAGHELGHLTQIRNLIAVLPEA
jgi:hypothetical protein